MILKVFSNLDDSMTLILNQFWSMEFTWTERALKSSKINQNFYT